MTFDPEGIRQLQCRIGSRKATCYLCSLMEKNFQRMMQLAEEAFDVRNDPEQLNVDEKVISRLVQIDPAAVSELANEDGPYCWILLIPTTAELMNEFINGKISEQELFDRTPIGASYDSIYLCSAMVLEEFRKRGIASRVTLEAIAQIRSRHDIKTLFVWPFSEEGNKSARSVAEKAGLPLMMRA